MSIFVENSLLVPTFLNTPRQSPKGQLKLDVCEDKLCCHQKIGFDTKSIDPEPLVV